jgi:hypothetical protein
MQCAQPDDRSRHAGLRSDPLTRKPKGETQPPVYSRTNAPNLWLIVATLGAIFAVWLTWRDVRLAARLMLVLEGVSVLAILLLAIVVLTHVPLSLSPFKPEPSHGWAGIGYGIVFTTLSFAGFESATTLGEETRNLAAACSGRQFAVGAGSLRPHWGRALDCSMRQPRLRRRWGLRWPG